MLEAASAWAGEGLRVLAVAAGSARPEAALDERLEDDLELIGIVALHDPLRATAAASIAAAHTAGVGVRMLTGDHAATARTIGRQLGLPEEAIIARATPAEKLALVGALQAQGEIVAVTGDGVNDAPALRKADVGVAMGRSGTQAAREAAALVLTDDDFATIIAALAEGRRIGDNIRKFVAFLLSANFGEVIVFAIAIAAGLDPPLAVIQVLLVNLLTDGLPALALARDPASPLTMTTPPRRGDQLFDRRSWLALALIGSLVGGAATAAYLAGRGFGGDSAQTMTFATLALAELLIVFSIRSPVLSAWRLPANRWLLASVAASTAFLAGAIYLPPAHKPFETVALGAWPALTAVALAALPALLVEVVKIARRTPAAPPGGVSSSPQLARRPTLTPERLDTGNPCGTKGSIPAARLRRHGFDPDMRNRVRPGQTFARTGREGRIELSAGSRRDARAAAVGKPSTRRFAMSTRTHDTRLDAGRRVFTRIVVGIDGSQPALEAARQAALLQDVGGRLTLVSVWEVMPPIVGGPTTAERYDLDETLQRATAEKALLARRRLRGPLHRSREEARTRHSGGRTTQRDRI